MGRQPGLLHQSRYKLPPGNIHFSMSSARLPNTARQVVYIDTAIRHHSLLITQRVWYRPAAWSHQGIQGMHALKLFGQAESATGGAPCRRSSLAAIRNSYNQTLAAIPGAQCYGKLAQFLDPQDTPWRDRLLRDPTSRPLWRPAARRMVELHQKCIAITDEVRSQRAPAPFARRRTAVSQSSVAPPVASSSALRPCILGHFLMGRRPFPG